jgi:protein-disulfide isomerase
MLIQGLSTTRQAKPLADLVETQPAAPREEEMKANGPSRELEAPVSQTDHVRGSPLARVTLIGYGDFANPDCARTYRTVKKIQRLLGSRLRYVFRSFPEPLKFPNSETVAEAAECAAAQGKFWPMHDRIFENRGASDELTLSRYAADIGLDLKRFRSEMRTHAHMAAVQAGRRAGIRSGVVEAPTFFINSLRYRSAFGLTTLHLAVQAAAGEA